MSFTNVDQTLEIIEKVYSPFRQLWKGFAVMSGVGDENIKIGTHDGVFHCDEALACYLLKKLPDIKNAQIIRTRDPEILKDCSIVIDVGGIYDPNIHRYDHHQRDFIHTLSSIRPEFPNKQTRLSSAGLIYAHFGLKILEHMLSDLRLKSEEIKLIFLSVYDAFIEEIDGIDNGIPQYASGKQKYRITTHVSARVDRFNPQWNSPNNVDRDKLFLKAMELVGKEFDERVSDSANVWLPARNIVKEAIDNRFKVDSSGSIIELNGKCPWKEHLFQLEEELDIRGEIKFVIFTDNNWRVQGVPVQVNSFICRVFLKEEWQGLRDEALSQKSGIPGCIFVHSSGFIGGNLTRDGALQMALKTLEAEHL